MGKRRAGRGWWKRPNRPLRLEPLEDRRLLAVVYTADMDAEVGLFAEGEPISPAPSAPDLLAAGDTGISDADNLTNLDNSSPAKTLQFSVGNTILGAMVTIYADGTAIGNRIATSSTTIVTTNGTRDLADGAHDVTARQIVLGATESVDSAALNITIGTAVPDFFQPVLVGGYDTGDNANGVAVRDNLAYVANSLSGLQIVDISDPVSPVFVGNYDTLGPARDVVVVDDLAYIADGSFGGLRIIDIGNPAEPTTVSTYDTSGSAYHLTVVDDLVYLADGDSLQIFDVSNPAEPTLLSVCLTRSFPHDVIVVDDLAYVADFYFGLQIMDVHDPANPTFVGKIATTGRFIDVDLVGDRIYLTDYLGNLRILDVSNPAAPAFVGNYATDGSAQDTIMVGNVAYIGGNGLQVVDVSNSAAPRLLGICDTLPGLYGLAMMDDLVYAAAQANGLQIIDLKPAPDLQPSSDTGTSDSDNITDDNTPTFDVFVPEGSYYRFYRDGIQISGDYETGTSFTMPAQSRGVYQCCFSLVDAMGNVSEYSPALEVTIIDPAPSVPELLPGSDTGVSDTDNLTNRDNSGPEKTLQLSVDNTILGATVTIYADGAVIGNRIATSSTTIVTTNGTHDLADGAHNITARQTAPGGLESLDSAVLPILIDTGIPRAVTPVWLGSYDTSGYANDVAVVGNLAYVADSYSGLQIIDVSNPADPVWVGGYDTSGYAYGVTVVGNLAYVADSNAGLQIIDVSNPAAPVRLGGYDTDGQAFSVTMVANLAYVADGYSGFQIIDVSDPAVPVRLGGYDTSGYAHGVAVVDNLAYVADYQFGLQIIDIGNPAAPVWVGGYDTSGLAHDVVVAGRLVYVADYHAGLQIVDISDPAVPVWIGGYSGYTSSVTVVDNLAYVAGDDSGLQIINVSNPAAPVFAGSYHTSDHAYGVAVVDNLAYVADFEAGFQIVNVSPSAVSAIPDLQPDSDTGLDNTDNITDDATPTFDISGLSGYYYRFYRDGEQISGDYQTGGSFTASAEAVGIHQYTYALVDTAGNVSEYSPALTVTITYPAPSVPDLLPATDTGVSDTDNLTNLDNSSPEKALSFSVDDTIPGATVTLYADGTAIGSAVATDTITVVTTDGETNLADGTYDITVTQTVPGELESVHSSALSMIIDASALRLIHPVRLGGYDTDGYAHGVAVVDDLAYVTDHSAGLQIIDVGSPADPVWLGGYDTDGYAYGIIVVDNLAYVADGDTGLKIIDVGDPAAPVFSGGYDTDDYTYGVTVVGDLAYLADDDAGLQILDVSNPTSPVRLGGCDTSGYARDVTVVNNLAYVADGYAGLQIIDVSNPAAPVRLGGYDTSGYAYDIVVMDKLAYVADGDAGLQIIDVSNSVEPVLLGSYDTNGNTIAVAVVGNLAYVADGDSGLQIIDVSNPAVPVQVGGCVTSDLACYVAVTGNMAYIADSSSGLQVIDVSSLALPAIPDLQSASDTGIDDTDNITADDTPTIDIPVPNGCYYRFYRDGVQIGGDFETAGSLTMPAQAVGVYQYTYVLVDAAGNVSDSSPPLTITITRPPLPAPDLLAASDSGVFDADNVTNRDNGNPEKALSFSVDDTIPGATVTIYADGTAIGSTVATSTTTVVAGNGTFDLEDGVYDITAGQTVPGEPESVQATALSVTIDTTADDIIYPVWMGTYDLREVYDVTVVGDLAYVAAGGNLQIIDIHDPTAPQLVGTCHTGTTAISVVVSGNLAYVASSAEGLCIIDISDPTTPVLQDIIARTGDTFEQIFDVALSGDMIYIADGDYGLRIYQMDQSGYAMWKGGYRTDGNPNSVAVEGNTVYVVGEDSGLFIIDVSDPTAPVELGHYDTGEYPQGVTVKDNIVYVAAGATYLQIIDAGDPASPVLLSQIDTVGCAISVIVVDDVAYVSAHSAGLQMIDVSDPAAPARLGGYASSDATYGAAVVGNLAYMADRNGGLQILDLVPKLDLQSASDTGISDTDNITGDVTPTFDVFVPDGYYFRFYCDGVQIGGDFEAGDSFTTPVQANGVCHYAFALVDPAGNVAKRSPALEVTIMDSIPSIPELLLGSDTGVSDSDGITNLDNSNQENALQFSVGNTIAGATVTLYADDVAIGSAVVVGSTTIVTTDGAYDLTDGPYVITARQTPSGEPESLPSAALSITIITSIPEFTCPLRLGGYDTSGDARDLVVVGNIAYVVDGNSGLQIIDVSNPAVPVWLGGYNTSGYAYGVAVVGNLAYVADDASGLQIINVSAPASPVRLGGYDTSGLAYGVAVAGNMAYVADGNSGLQIISVANPASPVLRGTYNTSGKALGVTMVGNLAYVADGNSGLQIIDVSIPTRPERRGYCNTFDYAHDVAVVGNLAYVADQFSGLQIIDVSNPASPVRLGGYDTSGWAIGVAVAGNLAYVADGNSGLQIIDVSNPASPVRLGGYNTSTPPCDLILVENLAYVADSGSGLQIIAIDISPDLQAASDTGSDNTDNVTGDATPTFDVPVPNGYYFRFYRDGVQISGDYEIGPSFTAPPQPAGVHDFTFVMVDPAGNVSEPSPSLTVTIEGPSVVGRYVYYPDSIWGDQAAPDKTALVPGPEEVTATLANVVSHPDGIRGIYIDVVDLATEPTRDDFQFHVGGVGSTGSTDPATWTELTVAPTITVIPNAGVDDSTRISLQWPTGAIRNTWLEVKLLPADDVFYFASVVGETNEPLSGAFMVNAADLGGVRDHPRSNLNRAPIDFVYDFNRDGLVNAADFGIVRDHPATVLNGVKVLTLPAVASSPAPAVAEGVPMPPPDWLDRFDDGDALLKRSADPDAYPLLIDLLLGGG